MQTYFVNLANLATLQSKLEKLNRRARKLGIEPASLIEVGRRVVEEKDRVQVVLELQVTGEAPMLAGWTLVAKIEYLGEERLIKCVPGLECPEEFRTRDTSCDHCKSSRIRKNVFVLRHDDGRHVQVGRQCICDFLGGASPEGLLAQAEWGFNVSTLLGESESEGEGGGRSEDYLHPQAYLAAVAICVRRLGWVSRTADPSNCTAVAAWSLLDPPVAGKARLLWQKWVETNNLHPQEQDEKMARDTLAWAEARPTLNVSDYLYNLGVAARAGFVTGRSSGILASAVVAYAREMEWEIERKRDAAKVRQHVGTPKKRETFTVTVKTVKYLEGNYGTTTLCVFEDDNGNLLKWFASGSLDIERGEKMRIKATVKAHEEYQGVPQTVIQRAVIEEVLAA